MSELVFQCLLLEKGVEQSHKMPTEVLNPSQLLKFQKKKKKKKKKLIPYPLRDYPDDNCVNCNFNFRVLLVNIWMIQSVPLKSSPEVRHTQG